jgi:membrane-bound lytic murein transglycosylase D
MRWTRAVVLTGSLALVAPAVSAKESAAKNAPAKDDPERGLAERRAVRGSPVDDAGPIESPELREIRRFEESAFPRSPIPRPAAGPDSALPPPTLPGAWGGSGDVPPELRSPSPTDRAETTAPDSDWLRQLKLPELPIRWDPQVLRYLDYFKNDPKGRAVMTNWLRRAARYRELIEKVLAREGLPKDLLYVAMVESGFDTGARSRVGAGGIWQFMPSAARAYGLEVSYWTDGRRDPERSVEAAARYLKDLYVRFGSWPLVFAAYNAGYGAVLRSITRYNTNDFWELIRHESGLPWESSLYVPKILAAAIVGNNLGAFGYADVACDPPFAYEEVEVPPGTPLASVARAAGARPEVVESLNPHLIRTRTPPDRGATRVRVPTGTAAACVAAMEKTRTGADKLDTVVVRFGETLDDVARARGVSVRELRKLNGVKDSAELRAGMSIVISKQKEKPAEKTDKTPEDGEADDSIIVAVPDRAFGYDGRERVFYRTRDGDTLEEIADAFGVRGEDLVEWNNIDPGARLHPRMVLQIFVRKDFDPAGIVLLDPGKVRVVTLGSEEFLELETARRGKKRLFYTCKAGDTLAKLGRRYGLTPGDLARINRFSYNTELHEGDRIVVYSPTGDAPREVSMGMTPSKKRPERGAPPARATETKPGAAKSKPAAAARSTASARDASAKKPTAAAKLPATASVKVAPAGAKSAANAAATKSAATPAKKK